jgi:hypothetical protein
LRRNWTLGSQLIESTSSPSPAAFVEAMTRPGERQRAVELEIARREEITEAALREAGEAGLVDSVRVARQESEVVIDTSALVDAPNLFVTVTEKTSVQEFVNFIYFSLDGVVKPFSYGQEWRLVDPQGGRVFSDLGSGYSGRKKRGSDQRLLNEVGIRPGMRLAVERPL